jgi:transcriptional regulator with XRE-family HTH domain
MTMGQIIKELREARGLTQDQLAKRARITRPYLTMLEQGSKSNPSPAIIKRLARVLGVSGAELAGAVTRWQCERCGVLLVETLLVAGGAAFPMRHVAETGQDASGPYLRCVGCGERVDLFADPPGGNFFRSRAGVEFIKTITVDRAIALLYRRLCFLAQRDSENRGRSFESLVSDLGIDREILRQGVDSVRLTSEDLYIAFDTAQ